MARRSVVSPPSAVIRQLRRSSESNTLMRPRSPRTRGWPGGLPAGHLGERRRQRA